MEKKNITVVVSGVEYPCRQTMGAMLRFKQETGREITDISGDLSDMCTFLWCCVKSACKVDGKKFDMSLMDFADRLDASDVEAWAQGVSDDSASQDAKKKVKV